MVRSRTGDDVPSSRFTTGESLPVGKNCNFRIVRLLAIPLSVEVGRLNSSNSGPQRLPTKWLLALVVGLALYGLLQPTLNKRLGLKLPSIASILSSDDRQAKVPPEVAQERDRQSANRTEEKDSRSSDAPPSGSDSTTSLGSSPNSNSPGTPLGTSQEKKQSDERSATNDLKYGLLKPAGRGAFLSPQGILYTPYSGPDRHRLDHIAKHTKDDPARPIHGVFEGDMPKVVVWLDEAYAQIKSRAKSVKEVKQGSRTRYDVGLGKTIGYIGGRDGARSNNPKSQTVRMIMEKTKIITAYPVR